MGRQGQQKLRYRKTERGVRERGSRGDEFVGKNVIFRQVMRGDQHGHKMTVSGQGGELQRWVDFQRGSKSKHGDIGWKGEGWDCTEDG